MKPVVRAALLPSVGISEAAVDMSLAMKAVIVGLMLLASVLATLSLRRGSVPGKAWLEARVEPPLYLSSRTIS